MTSPASPHMAYICLIIIAQVVSNAQTSQLPGGPSEILVAPEKDARTTIYVEATRNGAYPIGVLTSTVDTFINDGTTTEYMTQHLGTYIRDNYAKIESTSTREYYHVQETEGPVGLVSSSIDFEVHRGRTTEHTVQEYRTYIDGSYAHLVSSKKNIYSDSSRAISATPIYRPGIQFDAQPRDNQIRPSQVHAPGVFTKTVGGSSKSVPVKLERLIKDYKGESNVNVIKARSINFDETSISPSRVPKSIPTFTVDRNGTFDIPAIEEAPEIENEIEPTSSSFHRFDNQAFRTAKTSLDSVTYIGFVDFTTTIDDTVVIFKPKKTFRTSSRNVLIPQIATTKAFAQERIQPTAKLEPIESQRVQTLLSNQFSPVTTKKPKGINSLKSLLAAGASRRNKFAKFGGINTENEVTSGIRGPPRPRLTINPILKGKKPNIQKSEVSKVTAKDQDEVVTSPVIDTSIDSDVELVYKTLYTTYTYFTTFFRGTTTRVKSREDVVSNVVTLTNILEPSDLASLKESCQVDSTCVFATSEISKGLQESSSSVPFTEGFIGRPNTRPSALLNLRQSNARKLNAEAAEGNNLLKTFYTTYTYFTTLFVDGSSSVSTRTEIYSNVESSASDEKIQATSAKKLEAIEVTATSSEKYSTVIRDDKEESTGPKESFIVVGSSIPEHENPTITIQPSTVTEEVTTTSSTTEATPELEESIEGLTTVPSLAVEKDPDFPSELKTYYTTFTYYTTVFRNGTSSVTSNLETVSNIGTVNPTEISVPASVTFFTTFTYWTTLIQGDKTITTSSEETRTDVLPASMTDKILPSSTIQSLVIASTPIAVNLSGSSGFEEKDTALVLTTSETTRKPPPRAFTPNIRPNLIRPRTRPNNRLRDRTLTSVAIVTRSDVTPTLIATPVSSPLQPTPTLDEILESSSLIPSPPSSEIPDISRPSKVNTVGPSIVSGLRLRRPNTFQARLRERQRLRLQSLRAKNKDFGGTNTSEEGEANPTATTTPRKPPTFNFPALPNGRSPIFVSSRTETFKRPSEETTSPASPQLENLRERARARINSLFKRRRRPNRFNPFRTTDEREQQDSLVAEESRRRKRQVSEYGTRTRARTHRTGTPPASSDNLYNNSDDFISSLNENHKIYYRKSRQSTPNNSPDDFGARRSSSRFNPQSRFRSRAKPPPTERTTTTSFPPRTHVNSRFRPKTKSLSSLRHRQNQKNLRTSNKGLPRTSTQQKRPLRTRKRPSRFRGGGLRRITTAPPKPAPFIHDYDYADYYDYADTDIQPSRPITPEYITITKQVQINTAIPIFENGRETFRDILTASPSLQVIAATALKSTNIDNSPVIYANAITNQIRNGVEEITYEALRATETTLISFTPTRIRGIKTSFSHVIPTTVYNVNPITTSVVKQVDQNQLLSQLLLQLLGGQANNGQLPNLLLGGQQQQQQPIANLPVLPKPSITPATQYVTHTSSYVTTISKVDSTIVTITLHGREIKTTLLDKSTEVVTATEFSTETIIAPTAVAATNQPLAQQLQTAPVPFPALGGSNNPLRNLLPGLQQQLLAAQLQQQLQKQAPEIQIDLPEAASEVVIQKVESPDVVEDHSESQPRIIVNVRSEIAVVEGTVSSSSSNRRKRSLILSSQPAEPLQYPLTATPASLF